MEFFQVQCWPGGKWDHKRMRKIEAQSAKDAAEKICGHPLKDRGQAEQIRAKVYPLGKGVPSVFYASQEKSSVSGYKAVRGVASKPAVRGRT